jgi:hypothetical protein
MAHVSTLSIRRCRSPLGLREWAVESDDGLMVFAETVFAQ